MRMIRNLLSCLAAASVAASVWASPAAPANNVEYSTLPQIQATDAGSAVEVTEFFSYNCPHCHAFDPALAAWVKKQGKAVVFKRVHLALLPNDATVQRMYATLEAMGLAEQNHAKIFNTIHEQRQRITDDESVFNWIAKNGIDRTAFIATYRSFGMQARVGRANRLTSEYDVQSWPTIAIGGRYLTSPTAAGTTNPQLDEEGRNQAALQVMDFLVAKSKSDKK
jgi:thiol:disulfide interchange protein DsbA